MQLRHRNPERYFEEQAISCRNYYIPFLAERTNLKFDGDCHVLEIGCGLGGILSAFAEKGCSVTGVDISREAVDFAHNLFVRGGGYMTGLSFAQIYSISTIMAVCMI